MSLEQNIKKAIEIAQKEKKVHTYFKGSAFIYKEDGSIKQMYCDLPDYKALFPIRPTVEENWKNLTGE